jgi:integrase
MISEAKQRQSRGKADNRERSEWPKTDLRYWQDVVYRPQYRRGGEIKQSENYVARIGLAGERTTFALGTPNRAAAALKARDIYNFVAATGLKAACAAFKRTVQPKARPVTVGEFLSEAQKHLQVRPKTFADYARALRLIASSIAGIESDNSKFDYQSQKGGHAAWLAKVNAIKLSRLTPEKIREWYSAFLARAGGDPMRLKQLRVSANSFIRSGKALFSPKLLKQIELEAVPASPFADFEIEQVSLRYRSNLNFEALLAAAAAELGADDKKRELFKIFLLAACAGLRRSEIDKLEWASFYFDQGFIRIESTAFFEGKSQESHEDVYIDPEIVALFRGFRAEKAKDCFVVESGVSPRLGVGYSHYRCQRLFDELICWLRGQGVKTRNALHTLRKEYGSQLTKVHGIFVASRALRHSSVAVTESFYASQKQRVSLGLGHLLKAENVIQIGAETNKEAVNE